MAGTFDRLGNNLGALGLLIDMLNYQPALAKKLFVFDPELGELRPVMGRATTNGTIGLPASDHPVLPVSQETTRDGQGAASQFLGDASAASLGPDWALDLALPGPIPDEVRELARQELGTVEGVLSDMGLAPMAVEPSQGSGQEAPQVEVTEIDEDDLQDIFLEEANEVIANGLEALDLLAIDPHDLTQQTTLRRAFHTLKGSSRMVSLMEFGEAAWSLEQLLNAWLSEQKPASPDLCGLSREALLAFQTWVSDISHATASHWSAAVFRTAADALRKDNIRLPLELQPGAPTELVEVPQVEVDPGTAALEEMPDEEFSESTDLAPMVEESIPAETLPLEEPDLAGYLDSTASGPLGPVDVPGAQEIVSIEVDFDSLAELVPVSTTQAEGGVVEPLVAMEEIPLAEPERDLAPPVSDMVEEEQIKVIGSLRIGIPLYNVYLNEADEWSRRLSNQLSEWSLEVHRPVPSDAEALAHSLAGSSATVGFSSLSDMARALEHALQHMAGQHGGTDHQGRVFREAAEDIRRLLHQFAAGFLKEPNPFILEELRALEFGDAVSASQVVEAPVFPPRPGADLGSTACGRHAAGGPDCRVIRRTGVAAPGTEEAPVERGVIAQPSPSWCWTDLVNQAGEVMITRSRLEAEMTQLRDSLQDLTGNLDRLRHQLRDIELQAEARCSPAWRRPRTRQQNFDPLEFDRFTRVQELTRMMAESVNDVATVQRSLQRTVDATEDDLVAQARQTRDCSDDLLRTRMVEFEGISERLYRVVRQASKETGKQVKLDINGGSIEMDRGVLDRMTAAFEHLLRNCVARHRSARPCGSAGKDSVGTITIDLQQEGNDVSVSSAMMARAGPAPHPGEGHTAWGLCACRSDPVDEEVANLIFMPGFTTATEVTELAGRGIGMDVVRSEVKALGGRIETSTQQGRGHQLQAGAPADHGGDAGGDAALRDNLLGRAGQPGRTGARG
jgi:chemotaxis protein histidine kinase CheA